MEGYCEQGNGSVSRRTLLRLVIVVYSWKWLREELSCFIIVTVCVLIEAAGLEFFTAMKI